MSKKITKTDIEITMQVMAGWYMSFCQSKHYSKLKKIAQKNSEHIIIDLLSLMHQKFHLKPDDWNAKALDEYCHEALADERHYRGEEYFKCASQVLLAFFKYLDEMKLHKNIKELLEIITKHQACILDSYYQEDETDDGEQYAEAEKLTDQWLEKFIKSKFFDELENELQENCQDIIIIFSEMMYSYTGLKIDRWDVSGLEEICLDVMPRKIMAGEEYFELVVHSLHAFFLFMAENKINKNADKLAKKVKDIQSKIIKASKKSSNWGIGKQILSQAIKKGVDLSDKSKLTSFLNSMMGKPLPSIENEENFEEDVNNNYEYDNIVPFVRKEEKIGRNDPCSCGSGKKYKKCCGK